MPPARGHTREPELDAAQIERFHEQGYLVLRSEIDAHPLSEEVDLALAAADGSRALAVGGGQVRFLYAPMMADATPASIRLLERFALTAEMLLGRRVLPVRAKGTRYYGDTAWHRDSEHGVASVGFLAYLEDVSVGTGALRVVPGSHQTSSTPVPGEPGVALETRPGDVIVFDEHLVHGSLGGSERRQWRVDYVIDPNGPAEEQLVRGYFGQIFRPGSPGYDARRFPSYGHSWRAMAHPWVRRLDELGVYRMAAALEGSAE
ncbi:MAG TPA: phytanoyl-CoA dioxygenase family protein [Acidimicrobiales bacterium]|nr:phytanoyl-CoA dioxygenase family protein [Acidimicrobiales bacterium]